VQALHCGRAERVVLLLFALVSLAACPDRPADSALETPQAEPVHDTRDSGAPSTGTGQESYEYIAKRAFATVAVAESRGLEAERVKVLTESLATSLSECASQPATITERGTLRLVVALDSKGQITGTNLVVSDETVRRTALLCFVVPAKTLSYGAPTPTPSARSAGIAFEALWGKPMRQ
jgi:hypothetical protein